MSTLAGTSWQATGINNGKEAVVSQEGTEKVTAQFGADGTLSGSGGCNTYSGPYTTSGADQITIGALASTEMACPEPAMEIEQMYFAALANVATYQIEGTTLTLRDAGGATQAAFTLAAVGLPCGSEHADEPADDGRSPTTRRGTARSAASARRGRHRGSPARARRSRRADAAPGPAVAVRPLHRHTRPSVSSAEPPLMT